jgi:glycosyltransferase involved in cell wall biosynthesis
MSKKAIQEKIAIIAPANLKYVPYVDNYIRLLKDEGVCFHVLSWDKRGLQESEADFVYHFCVSDSNRKKMLLGHGLFARKCRGYIRRNKITKLIILTAAPAFFLGTGFLKKFSGRFILDIRDDTPLVKRFPGTFRKICDMASRVISSSPKFNEWIPTETQLCHNADTAAIAQRMDIAPKDRCGSPISIVFAGMLNESRINLEMLQHIGKDPRFQFRFIGRVNEGKEKLRTYAEAQGLDNVAFQGTYNKDEIYGIYASQADLVNIIREKCKVNRNALPNKLYDAVLAGVPVVVFDHNEAVADYVRQYSLGLVLEENMQTLGDTLAQRTAEFDYAAYARGRKAFLQKVMDDMEAFRQTVSGFAQA